MFTSQVQQKVSRALAEILSLPSSLMLKYLQTPYVVDLSTYEGNEKRKTLQVSVHCIYSDFFRLCLLNTVTWFVFSPFSWKHITSSIWMAKPSGNNNACSLNHNKWSSLSKNCSRWCVSFPQMYKCRKKSHVNVPRWRLPTGSEIYFQQENTISSFTQRLTAWCCFSWAHLGIQMVMASRFSLTKRNFRKSHSAIN